MNKKYTIILEFRTKENIELEQIWELGQTITEFTTHTLKEKMRVDTIVSPTVRSLQGHINDHE